LIWSGATNERHYSFSMHRMQGQKLFQHEEQEEHYRQDSVEEVLQKLQASYAAQRDKGMKGTRIKDRPVALTARASDSKSEGWGFESLLACQKNGMSEEKQRGNRGYDGQN
jgi:hypothetical protein